MKEKPCLYKNIWWFAEWTRSAGFWKPNGWQWDPTSVAHSSTR